MAEKKIIAVVGSTGAQGGALARAILNDPNSEFAVRAITRDVNSEKAKELASLGAEVVAADIDDPAAVKKAFEGAYGAYCVTFFWSDMNPDREIAQAKIMAQAAKETGLKHVIWSTLEDIRKYYPVGDKRMPDIMVKYKVPHFDAKGESDHFFKDAGVPATYLITSFYWDNFIHFGMGPAKGPDGNYAITLPMGDKKLAGIASEDIGKCAYGVFKRGNEFVNKTIGIAGDHITGQQIADSFTKVLGTEIRYNEVTPEAYRGFGFPGAEELGNMFQFYRDDSDICCGNRNLDFSRSLNPELQTFETWVKNNKNNIPL